MLIVFKSAASGDIITFEKNARQLLDALGKDKTENQGIITTPQLVSAIQALRGAMQQDAANHASQPNQKHIGATETSNISFHRRAVPLLEMLERSLQENVPVTWGV
jgi:GTP cyclohydrolase I